MDASHYEAVSRDESEECGAYRNIRFPSLTCRSVTTLVLRNLFQQDRLQVATRRGKFTLGVVHIRLTDFLTEAQIRGRINVAGPPVSEVTLRNNGGEIHSCRYIL
jgi:hypothetical protein